MTVSTETRTDFDTVERGGGNPAVNSHRERPAGGRAGIHRWPGVSPRVASRSPRPPTASYDVGLPPPRSHNRILRVEECGVFFTTLETVWRESFRNQQVVIDQEILMMHAAIASPAATSVRVKSPKKGALPGFGQSAGPEPGRTRQHRMQDEGLVETVRQEQAGNFPARTVYAITDRGRQELSVLRHRALSHAEVRADPVDVALTTAARHVRSRFARLPRRAAGGCHRAVEQLSSRAQATHRPGLLATGVAGGAAPPGVTAGSRTGVAYRARQGVGADRGRIGQPRQPGSTSQTRRDQNESNERLTTRQPVV
jgi:hypothetical protein